MSVFRLLKNLEQGRLYWLLLMLLSVILEATALYYQYVLEYYPCVLCIHVRVWLLGVFAVALLAWFVRGQYITSAAHLLMLILWSGMTERSYQLLGVERGFLFGSCDMDAGLPSWFALDQWFPSVFKVWEACGYTPEIIFGITMAEILLVMSVLLSLLALLLTVNSFRRLKNE